MPHRRCNRWRVGAFALGLLNSPPGSALELHLDAAAWQVPAFNLPAPAPPLGLQHWQLNGAFHSSQGGHSLALISIDGAAALAFRPGELIANGIYLQAVYSDHVRVQRGAAEARLYLQGGADQAATPVASPPKQPVVTAPSATCLGLQQQVPLEELATLGICPQ